MLYCCNEECKAYETGFEYKALHEDVVYYNSYVQRYESLWSVQEKATSQQPQYHPTIPLEQFIFQPIFVKLSCPHCHHLLAPCHHCSSLLEVPSSNPLPHFQHCETCGFMNFIRSDILSKNAFEWGVLPYDKARCIQRMFPKKESQYLQYKQEQIQYWSQLLAQDSASWNEHQRKVLQFLIHIQQNQMEQFEQPNIIQFDLEQRQKQNSFQTYWNRFNASHIPLLETLYEKESHFSFEVLRQFFSQLESLQNQMQTHTTIELAHHTFQKWIINNIQTDHLVCLQNTLQSAKEQQQMSWRRETKEYLQLLQQINVELQHLIKQVMQNRQHKKTWQIIPTQILPNVPFQLKKLHSTFQKEQHATDIPSVSQNEEEQVRKIEFLLSCYQTVAHCIIQK